jgi:hypothetical protein
MLKGVFRMKQKLMLIEKVIYFILISIVFVTITGCSNNKKEDSVSYIIKQIYQAPDSELINLSDKMLNDENLVKDDNLENSEFFKNLTNRYEDYMSPECYEKIISQRIPYKYHLSMEELGYVMEVVSIDIDKNSNSDNLYNFSVNICFGPPGNEDNNITIKGSAQFENNSNRINFLRLLDEDLEHEINEIKTS